MTALELITAPAAEPVSTSDAKDFLRVDSSDDDTLIASLVTAARHYVENFTNRSLITQTWKVWWDAIPVYEEDSMSWEGVRQGHLSTLTRQKDYLELPRGPIQSISSVNYYTTDNSANVFSSANYYADTKSTPGRMVLNYGQAWMTGLRNQLALNVQYVAGYGAAGSNLPVDLLTGLKMILAHLYEYRGDDEAALKMPKAAKLILDRYRILKTPA